MQPNTIVRPRQSDENTEATASCLKNFKMGTE